MIITNTLQLSDGSSAANVFMTVNIHTEQIESTGKAPVDLLYWRSEADKNSGMTGVWPVVSSSIVSSCILSFNGSEIVKVGPNCTVADTFTYYKGSVAEALLASYGWNINL